jgi:hypothetical protein
MWQIPRLRDEAIERLTDLLNDTDAAEMLLLGERYDVPQWCLTALCALVNRKEQPTIADVERLGIERILKVVGLREERLAHEFPAGIDHPANCGCGAPSRSYHCCAARIHTQVIRPTQPDVVAAAFGL